MSNINIIHKFVVSFKQESKNNYLFFMIDLVLFTI